MGGCTCVCTFARLGWQGLRVRVRVRVRVRGGEGRYHGQSMWTPGRLQGVGLGVVVEPSMVEFHATPHKLLLPQPVTIVVRFRERVMVRFMVRVGVGVGVRVRWWS